MLLLLGASSDTSLPSGPVACGSGDHAWWVTRDGDAWVVQHAAREPGAEAPLRRDVARFDDQPVAIACDDAAAWIFFRGANGSGEVLAFQAAYNPVSRLWFNVPAAGRLFASVPCERLESVAALDGEAWALEAGTTRAWRLQGERWLEVTLPAEAMQAASRRLVTQGDALWLVARMEDGSGRRWRRDPTAWTEVPCSVTGWTEVVPGCAMLTLVVDGHVAPVQAGAADVGVRVPEQCNVLGWGDGVLALRMVDGQPQAAVCASPRADFGPFFILSGQRSGASRWYHLPLLGVLSLAALMLAGSVRVLRPESMEPWPAPMPLGRRVMALVLDLFPLGAAATLATDTGPVSLLRVPLWTTDLSDSVPFLMMVAGAAAFGFVEEWAGSRSLGKRLMGGRVLRRDGAPAGCVRHAVRNLLKALVLLSPVLALPALSRGRHEGVPEVVSGTMVTAG